MEFNYEQYQQKLYKQYDNTLLFPIDRTPYNVDELLYLSAYYQSVLSELIDYEMVEEKSEATISRSVSQSFFKGTKNPSLDVHESSVGFMSSEMMLTQETEIHSNKNHSELLTQTQEYNWTLTFDELNLKTLNNLESCLAYFSQVKVVSNNPKKINLFTVEFETDGHWLGFEHVLKWLFRWLFRLAHGEIELTKSRWSKGLCLARCFLWISTLENVAKFNTMFHYCFGWGIKLLRTVYEKLAIFSQSKVSSLSKDPGLKLDKITPLTTNTSHNTSLYYHQDDDSEKEQEDRVINDDEIQMILNGIQDGSFLAFKALHQTYEIKEHWVELINLFGIFTGLSCYKIDKGIFNPNQRETQLMEFGYGMLHKGLKSSRFQFQESFPTIMKWLYYHLTNGESTSPQIPSPSQYKQTSQRATSFLINLIRDSELTIPIEELQLLFKHVATEFSDRAEVRANLGSHLACIMIQLTERDAQFLLENLWKDALRAGSPNVRFLTLELFSSWVDRILKTKSSDQEAEALNQVRGRDKSLNVISDALPSDSLTFIQNQVSLVLGLITSLTLRFNDRIHPVRAKALASYLHVLNTLRSIARRRDHPQCSLAIKALSAALSGLITEKHLNLLEKLGGEVHGNVRKPVVGIVGFVLSVLLEIHSQNQSENEDGLGIEAALRKLEFEIGWSWHLAFSRLIQVLEPRLRDVMLGIRKLAFSVLFKSLSTCLSNSKSVELLGPTEGSIYSETKTLFDLWHKQVLTSMFDTDRNLVLELLSGTQNLLLQTPSDYLYTLLDVKLSPLAYKGLSKSFSMIAELSTIEAIEIAKNPSHIPVYKLLKDEAFIRFIVDHCGHQHGYHLGYWQLVRAVSNYRKLPRMLTPLMKQKLLDILTKLLDLSQSHINESEINQYNDLSISSEYILEIGKCVLEVLFNWLALDTDGDILKLITKNLYQWQVPKAWLEGVVHLLVRWGQEQVCEKHQQSWYRLEMDERYKNLCVSEAYTKLLIQRSLVQWEKYMSEMALDPIPAYSKVDQNAQAISVLLVGYLNMHHPNIDNHPLVEALLMMVGRRTKTSDTNGYLVSSAMRAHAFMTMGRMALMDLNLAKQLIPILLKEIELRSEWFIQVNPTDQAGSGYIGGDKLGSFIRDAGLMRSLIVLSCDLSLRFMQLMEPYLGWIPNQLRYPHSEVRRSTWLSLTRLIRMDYLKVKPRLLFKMIVSLVMEDDLKIRGFAEYCLSQVILKKYPNLLFEHFPRFLRFVNGHPLGGLQAKEATLEVTLHPIETRLFVFNSESERARRYRHRCYQFILKSFDAEQKFRATHLLCEFVLKPAIRYNWLDSESGRRTLVDAMHILTSQEIALRVPNHINRLDDIDLSFEGEGEAYIPTKPKINVEDLPYQQEKLEAIQEKLIRKIRLRNVVENLIPSILELRHTLEKRRDPLQGALWNCLVRLVIGYRVPHEQLVNYLGTTLAEELRCATKSWLRDEAEAKSKAKAKARRAKSGHAKVLSKLASSNEVRPEHAGMGLFLETPKKPLVRLQVSNEMRPNQGLESPSPKILAMRSFRPISNPSNESERVEDAMKSSSIRSSTSLPSSPSSSPSPLPPRRNPKRKVRELKEDLLEGFEALPPIELSFEDEDEDEQGDQFDANMTMDITMDGEEVDMEVGLEQLFDSLVPKKH